AARTAAVRARAARRTCARCGVRGRGTVGAPRSSADAARDAAVAHCARGGTRTPPAARARGDRARRARVRRAARDRARALVGVRGRGLVLRADALDERVLDLFVLARDLAALRTLGEVGD